MKVSGALPLQAGVLQAFSGAVACVASCCGKAWRFVRHCGQRGTAFFGTFRLHRLRAKTEDNQAVLRLQVSKKRHAPVSPCFALHARNAMHFACCFGEGPRRNTHARPRVRLSLCAAFRYISLSCERYRISDRIFLQSPAPRLCPLFTPTETEKTHRMPCKTI